MATLKIINRDTYNGMRSILENPEQLNIYITDDNYPEITDECLLGTTINLPDTEPALDVTAHRTANDADNAVKIYNYLGPLSRTQAADSRLWATLTHTTFWDYCKKRWPVDGNSAEYIYEHWFEKKGAGLGALRRNAISRLWWAAHLTLAPWEQNQELEVFRCSDRAKYTHILLSQAQIFMDILERSYGSNLRLRICLLDSLSKYLPLMSNKDDLSKEVSKTLNLVLKHRQIDAMHINDLRLLLDDLVKKSSERLLEMQPVESEI